MKINNVNACLLTYPMHTHGSYYNITINLLNLLSTNLNKLLFISGNFPAEKSTNNTEIFNLNHPYKKNLMIRFMSYVHLQLKISNLLLKNREKYDVCLILASFDLFLPLLTIYLLGKKPILVAASKSNYFRHDKRFIILLYIKLISTLEKISFILAYKIVLETPSVSNFMKLDKYNKKLLYGPLFIAKSKFKRTSKIEERPTLIGYIGRLSEEKGVLNFINSIPPLINTEEMDFLICGEGPLENKIYNFIQNNKLEEKVDLKSWIKPERLPFYLNNLKLLIVPSYTEGLPNIVLEAMSCGTPVLATPVGGIPDIITDGKNGFIMENNSPECIQKNIIRALNSDIELISENSINYIQKEFNYSKISKTWAEILIILGE